MSHETTLVPREVNIPSELWNAIVELGRLEPEQITDVNGWTQTAYSTVRQLTALPPSDTAETITTLQTNLNGLTTDNQELRTRTQDLENQVANMTNTAQDLRTRLDNARDQYEELQDQFEATTNALVTEQQRGQAKDQVINTLTTALAAAQNNPTQNHNDPDAPPTTGNKAVRMADPEKFSGNTDKYHGWKSKLLLKLQEPGSFADEQAKCRYIVGLLEGHAYDQIDHLVDATRINVENAAALITLLTTCYADPDPRGTAERALQKCFQGSRRFADYHAEMNRYLNKLQLGDESRKVFVYKGLSRELKDAIANADTVPEEYTPWVTWLTKKDLRLSARRSEVQDYRPRQPFTPRQNAQTNQTPAPRNTAPNTTPTPTTAAHPTNSNSGHYGPAPMDLSAGRRTLSQEERTRRLAEGLCMYCGGQGHLARNCPAAARRNLRVNAATLNQEQDRPDESLGDANEQAKN